jgi:hypothetical protein
MKKKIIVDASDHVAYIDGKYYARKRQTNDDKLILVEIDKKTYDKRLKKLAKKLAPLSKLTVERILIAALRNANLDALARIERALKQKKPVEAKKGCLYLSVGGTNLDLVS